MGRGVVVGGWMAKGTQGALLDRSDVVLRKNEKGIVVICLWYNMSKTFTWSCLGEGMSFLSSLKVFFEHLWYSIFCANGGSYKCPS